MTKQVLIGPALLLVSLVVVFALLEAGLRIIGYDPVGAVLHGREQVIRVSHLPKLRYDLTPGVRADAWRTQVSINSSGFRDREYPTDSGGRFRIAVIGDSITFGNDLAIEDTLSEVLEARLIGASDRPVDVLNLGVGGYDAVQQVAFLSHRGLPFEPDLVVVGYCMNDVGEVSMNLSYLENRERIQSPIYWSRLAQFVGDSIGRIVQARRADQEDRFLAAHADEIVDVGGDDELMELIGTLHDSFASREEGWSPALRRRDLPLEWYASPQRIGRLAYAFGWLSELGREHGFRVVVVVIPALVEETRYELAYRIVEHVAKGYGFDVLQLEDAFRAEGFERLRIREDDIIHPNERGHELIAEGLRDYLLRGVLAQDRSRSSDARSGVPVLQ